MKVGTLEAACGMSPDPQLGHCGMFTLGNNRPFFSGLLCAPVHAFVVFLTATGNSLPPEKIESPLKEVNIFVLAHLNLLPEETTYNEQNI